MTALMPITFFVGMVDIITVYAPTFPPPTHTHSEEYVILLNAVLLLNDDTY
jgi:hypothetical protein